MEEKRTSFGNAASPKGRPTAQRPNGTRQNSASSSSNRSARPMPNSRPSGNTQRSGTQAPKSAQAKNEKKIAEYVRNQLQEDIATDQISMKEYIDPFTGDKNKKA